MVVSAGSLSSRLFVDEIPAGHSVSLDSNRPNTLSDFQFLFIETGSLPVRLILVSSVAVDSYTVASRFDDVVKLLHSGLLSYYYIPARQAHCFKLLSRFRLSRTSPQGYHVVPSHFQRNFLWVSGEKDPVFNLGKFGENMNVIYIGDDDEDCAKLREMTTRVATLRFRQFVCIEDMMHVEDPDGCEAGVVVLGPASRIQPLELAWIRTPFWSPG